jgi:hypothetical protein
VSTLLSQLPAGGFWLNVPDYAHIDFGTLSLAILSTIEDIALTRVPMPLGSLCCNTCAVWAIDAYKTIYPSVVKQLFEWDV